MPVNLTKLKKNYSYTRALYRNTLVHQSQYDMISIHFREPMQFFIKRAKLNKLPINLEFWRWSEYFSPTEVDPPGPEATIGGGGGADEDGNVVEDGESGEDGVFRGDNGGSGTGANGRELEDV